MVSACLHAGAGRFPVDPHTSEHGSHESLQPYTLYASAALGDRNEVLTNEKAVYSIESHASVRLCRVVWNE